MPLVERKLKNIPQISTTYKLLKISLICTDLYGLFSNPPKSQIAEAQLSSKYYSNFVQAYLHALS